jgi:DNA-binding CsgD family transcriptional regulator
MERKPHARLEGRNGEVWRLSVIRGKTNAWIAEHFGISEARVSQIVSDVRASVPVVDKQAMLEESLELIRYVKDQAIAIAELAGAPVAVGKDGTVLIDPATGIEVRDYSGRIRALETALKADDVMAKRFGLDAATKVESSATVRYELIGVDTEDLK